MHWLGFLAIDRFVSIRFAGYILHGVYPIWDVAHWEVFPLGASRIASGNSLVH